MSDLFEELCKIVEEVDPEFDRNNKQDLDAMTKSFILSMQGQKGGDELKESYFRDIVEKLQKERIEKMIKQKGQDVLKYELAKLNFEKEILERKIEVAKKFLN